MRIIGGKFKGKVIKLPKDLPVRPTTDFAKEALFNILSNSIDFDNLKVLDLFSGTGHISLEFASRGNCSIISVDKNFKCVGFLRSITKELNLEINALKTDVFEFLKKCNLKFDIIFADPPYDLLDIPKIHELVFQSNLLSENGLLIIEHGPKTKLEGLVGFEQLRKYGNVNFSFFKPLGLQSI